MNKWLVAFRRIESLTLCILTAYHPSTTADLKGEISSFYRYLHKRAVDRGIADAVRFVKSTRIAVMQFLCGTPLSGSQDDVALGPDGFPKWLQETCPKLRVSLSREGSMTTEEKVRVRILISLLISLRGIMLPPVQDFAPMTNPYKGELKDISASELHFIMGRMLGIKPGCGSQVGWTSFHLSTKAGPLGPALISSIKELPHLLKSSLRPNIETLGGEALAQWLRAFERVNAEGKTLIESIPLTSDDTLSKLSIFPDKEGKTRIVAIVDYWTQTCLRPYHKFLMGLLGGLPADCTFNHDDHVAKLSPLSGPYHSLDLTNATDRMPLWLQKAVWAHIFGKRKSEAWGALLVDREYRVRGSAPVIYNCGQPMGAYSSWATMALTHHFIVQWAAYKAGHRKMFTSYVVLGDDVVIADSAVAESYRSLLHLLDMPVSIAKTHVSEDSWEFAKRWFIKREEVSGFSIAGLTAVRRHYALLHGYLTTQAKHGWVLTEDQVPELVNELYGKLGNARKGRPGKLYNAFHYWKRFEASPEDVQAAEGLFKALGDLGVPIDTLRSFSSPSVLLFRAALRVGREVVEADLKKFNEGLPGAISTALSWSKANFRGSSLIQFSAWLPPLNVIGDRFSATLDDAIELCFPKSLSEYSDFDERKRPARKQSIIAVKPSPYFIRRGFLAESSSVAQAVVIKKLLGVLNTVSESKIRALLLEETRSFRSAEGVSFNFEVPLTIFSVTDVKGSGDIGMILPEPKSVLKEWRASLYTEYPYESSNSYLLETDPAWIESSQ